MKKNLRLLMMTLLCAVFSAAWGEDWSYTFSTTEKTFTKDETTTLNGKNWALAVNWKDKNSTDYNKDGSKGLKIGSNSKVPNSLTLSSSDFTGTITKVSITVAGRSKAKQKVTVTVGGENFGEKNIDNAVNLTECTFEGEGTGDISITVENLSSSEQIGAIYVSKMSVTTGTGDPVDPEISLEQASIFVGITASISKPSDLSLTCTSSDGNVATVDNDGVITGVGAGTATITATWEASTKYNAGSKQFTVTVEKLSPEIALPQASIFVGNTTTISKPDDITLTCSSSDDAVATVDNDGLITGVGAGTATITVSWEASAKYNAGSTLFVVTVEREQIYTYKKVASTSEITSGKYLIVYEDGNLAFDGSREEYDGKNNYKSVKIDNGKIVTNQLMYVTINTEDGSIQGMNEKYLGVISYGNGLGTRDKAVSHTITIDEFGNAQISIKTTSTEAGKQYVFFRFNSSSNEMRFRYFKEETYTAQKAVQLYKLETTPITITFKPKFKGYTSIYYSDKNLVVPEGVKAQFYQVENGKGKFVDAYAAGEVIPQGTPVALVYLDKDNLTADVTKPMAESTETPAASTTKNDLRGSDTAITTTTGDATADADYYFYRLTVGKAGSGNENNIGFYWGAEEGVPFTAGAHKVYLAVKQSEFNNANNAAALVIDDTDGIGTVSIDSQRQGVYTLSGTRMSGDSLPKGIYIVNGKKTVIK